MRIVRVSNTCGFTWGELSGDTIHELLVPGDELAASSSMVIRAWQAGTLRQSGQVLDANAACLECCITDPSKIIGIGLNYRDHAAEGGVAAPDDPLVFSKLPSALVGPGAAIRWRPATTLFVDFEAELGVVIGRPARDVPIADALHYVFGYCCVNDVSARDIQFSDGQWTRAKSLDTFCPAGPALVTADEIPDPQDLRVTCTVSGELMQDAGTRDMIFPVSALISKLSSWFTLVPGDLIATGTPSGVGYFRDPQRALRDGDEVTVEISGVGRLVNRVVVDTAQMPVGS